VRLTWRADQLQRHGPGAGSESGIASGVRRRRFSASNIVTIEKAPSLNASRRPVGIMVFVRWCQQCC